jgi:16S rRNA (adenine1518-N6/adenine1519-N6)-dimethyltransferase
MPAVCALRSTWQLRSRAAKPERRTPEASHRFVKHQPRRRFGQNFLVDASVIAAIVAAIHPARGDRMVEIGPGLGALTRPLLAAVEQMHAIEIDRDLAAALKNEFAPRLTVHVTDVLKFDLAALGNDLRVVGNLPYNISTPLLFHLADFTGRIRDIHVMLQKEIVERMVAAPSDSNHGRLSVMLQYRFELEKLLDVPAAAFDPAPKVESAVLRLTPLRPLPFAARDEALFASIVKAAFSQRRKTLRNSLRRFLSEPDFGVLAIAPATRAQELGVKQFVAIADYVGSRAAQAD